MPRDSAQGLTDVSVLVFLGAFADAANGTHVLRRESFLVAPNDQASVIQLEGRVRCNVRVIHIVVGVLYELE